MQCHIGKQLYSLNSQNKIYRQRFLAISNLFKVEGSSEGAQLYRPATGLAARQRSVGPISDKTHILVNFIHQVNRQETRKE